MTLQDLGTPLRRQDFYASTATPTSGLRQWLDRLRRFVSRFK